ncbi:MAG: DUF2948 family protein [Bosea sp. (in: a-proteobacteria)]
MTAPVAEPLKLIALDGDDLNVISAHLQDAILRAGDIAFRPNEKRFVLAVRRYDWEGAQVGHKRRRLAALHFERVTAVQSAKLDPRASETIHNLLAVTFSGTESPAGEVTLHFSEGAAIRLTVECIEAQMKDLGPMWETQNQPDHSTADPTDGQG